MRVKSVIARLRKVSGERRQGAAHDLQVEYLARLRAELAGSLPRVRSASLLRIVSEFGDAPIPDGFFVDGPPGDRRARLRHLFALADNGAASRRADWHPLFSSAFYYAAYPDVAASGIPPWLHYQVYGRAEGRSPHPLIEPKFLAASMPGVRLGDVVDEYLMSPDRWLHNPSPYVDCTKFVLSGRWDGESNPLLQIVTRGLTEWINERLMIVDASSDHQTRARLVGSAALLTRNDPGSRAAKVHYWNESNLEIVSEPAEFTVVPGYFVGASSTKLWSSDAVSSPDSTFLRLPTEWASIVSGERRTTNTLIVFTGPENAEAIATVVGVAATGMVALAPSSRAQEIVLRSAVTSAGSTAMVLDYGRQLRVFAQRLEIRKRDDRRPDRWDWSRPADPSDLAIVLHRDHRRQATTDPQLRNALAGGAVLSIVEEDEIDPWLPTLRSRAVVLVSAELLELVSGVLPDGSVHALPAGARSNP